MVRHTYQLNCQLAIQLHECEHNHRHKDTVGSLPAKRVTFCYMWLRGKNIHTIHMYNWLLMNLLTNLAVMPKSLYNHELSIVCHHWCHCHHCHCHCCHHLWTVLSTGSVTETSYFAHICTYAPSICTWINKYNLYFLNGSHCTSFLHVTPQAYSRQLASKVHNFLICVTVGQEST